MKVPRQALEQQGGLEHKGDKHRASQGPVGLWNILIRESGEEECSVQVGNGIFWCFLFVVLLVCLFFPLYL